MKFRTESVEKIEKILVAELAQQIGREEIRAEELEQGLRNGLQEVGRKSYGKMLSMLDQHHHGILSDCECGQEGKRVSQREAQVLSVFGGSNYRRSYYQCECGTRWFAVDQEHNLRAGQATNGMSRLLGLAGVTVSFEEASRQIQEYLQVDVCANTIR